MTNVISMQERRYKIVDTCELQNVAYEQLHADVRVGVRNADPTVWPVLEATGRLYRAHRTQLEPHLDHVGMIHYGSAFPKATAQRVMADIARGGRVSPTAFINANAGAALSICCTRFGFRGPTLNLTMPSADTQRLVDALAARWLAQGSAHYLILVAADFDPSGHVRATSTLTRKSDLAGE